MALTFEYVKDIETGTQPFICHEPDSTLYNYFIVDERAMDKSAVVPNGAYDDVIFDNEDRHLTTQAVSGIGVKNFPGIGGIGFYKDLFSDNCFIAAPIHAKREKAKAPTLDTAVIENGMLHIVITPPSDISYACYRVVVRQRYFAFEYITYKTDYRVDAPTVMGEYTCHCIGYDEAFGSVSEKSNEVTLVVDFGTSTWAPTSPQVLENRIAELEIEDRLTRLEDELGMEKCYGTDCDTRDFEGRITRLENELGMEVWYGSNTAQDLEYRVAQLEKELGIEVWYGN